jgi:hypothetical protein
MPTAERKERDEWIRSKYQWKGISNVPEKKKANVDETTEEERKLQNDK